MKKIIGLILSAMMCVSFLPVVVNAETYTPIAIDCFNGHKYAIYDESMTWYDAKKYCESLGGHLVTITSIEENNIILSFINKSSASKYSYWIGVFKDNDIWRNVTKEDFNYENWKMGEPNDNYNEESVVQYIYEEFIGDPGTWNDLSPNGHNYNGFYLNSIGFICEWDDYTVTRKTSTLISNHYQAPQYANASYGDLCKSTTSFIMTVENYERILLDALNNSLNKNANNDIEASKKQIRLNGAAQLQAKDNGTNDKMLSFYATFPKEDYYYCYEALYDIIADGGEDAIELQKINTDDEEIVVATNIVKEVLNGINNISSTKQYGKYDISVSALNLSFKFLGVENVFSGTMTVKNRTNKKTYTVAINSKMSDVADAMGAYIKQLIQLEQNIYKSELKKAIECIDKTSKISDFGTNYIKKKLNSFAESGVFSRIGLGKANETLGKCAEIYNVIKSVNQENQKVSDMIKKAKKIQDTLDSVIFDDTTITDKAIKEAYKKLNEARTNLQSYAISYLSGETIEEEKSAWDNFWSWLFKCPVDITVTDVDGNIVGYVKGEEVYYEEEILITKEGDVKKVYLPNTTDYNIVTTGNNYGLLNCTLENYENGEPVGRSNFYDIELYDGKEITINDDISDITTEHTNITLSSNEETVLETEYFDESDNAAITVSVNCENGGIAEGSGTYVKGDSITVLAIPNDGYVFKGWYKNDEWLSNDISYSFSANTNIDLVAKFDEYQEFISTYDLNISDRYNDRLIGDMQVENNIVTMSLYQKDETINTDDFTCYLAYCENDRLTSVEILTPIITEEGYIQFTSNIESSNFKIMLWNDFMMPIMSAVLSNDILPANEETAEN